MRKDILLPGVAVVGGAAGFLLRRWELSTAFEPDTGLPVAGAPATWALIALTVVVAAVLAVLCRDTHRVFPGGYDEAFGAPNNALYLTVLVAAAFLMAASGLLTFLLYLRHDVTAFSRVLLALMSLVSAACLFVVGKNNYRMEGRGKYSAALLLPSYTCCLWLISAYQARSADPVILDYVYQLFAVIAAVLGTYFTAGFAFERAKVFRASFFSLLGVYFCLVTLADRHDVSMLLLFVAFALYLLATTVLLQYNAARPEGPRMPRRLQPEDTRKTEINREGTPDEG
ncbi:hypothetical protein [Intestinimonas sp. UBA1698]|uniref:hypothetical protein n=1 Tax=Intestinimonas sp. UBA1698 TaxID=1946651 RepID=UPI00257EE550|nr:hypothetical protein [Intestinimonas sp. UBA1698]